MKAHWIVTALALLCGGCATFSFKSCHDSVAPIGFVTTGGRYCVAQSLAVPLEGLTLGSAVSKVVRIEPAARSAFAGSTVQRRKPELLPIGAQDIRFSKSSEAVKNIRVSGDFSEIKKALVDTSPAMLTADEYASLEADFRGCVNRAVGQNIFLLDETAKKQKLLSALSSINVRDRLSREIEAVAVMGLLWNDPNPILPSERTIDRTVELVTTVFEDLTTRDPSIRNEQVAAIRSEVNSLLQNGQFWPNSQPTTKEVAVDFLASIKQSAGNVKLADSIILSRDSGTQVYANADLSESVFVTLIKSEGRLISAPLWLVTNYSAGDILLSPGDHVELNAFSQTSIGIPTAATTEGNILAMGPMIDPEIVPLDSISATRDSFESFAKWNGNDVADVVVVRRVELSGRVHDFLLPIPRPELYQQSDAASEILSQANLQQGDQVHLEVLDLTPMIQESRRLSQQASRFAIEEAAAAEADSRRSWLQKKLVKHQEHKQKVCAQINSQTELVSGINPAQLATLTGDFHDNLSAQVGMAP